MKKIISVFVVLLFIFSCTSQKNISVASFTGLKFIGEYILPDSTVFGGTRVGGLSSIDYDPVNDLYYLICDDRSEHNYARYYTAKLKLSSTAIDSVRFIDVFPLLNKEGKFYASKTIDSLHVPDPEGLRLNGNSGDIIWTNEGERIVQKTYAILQNPSINLIGKNNLLGDSFALPANLHVSASEQGPRRNGVFEGLCFANDFKTLYVIVEEPLYEDGPRAGTGDSTAWIRLLKYDVKTKMPVAQYAYRLDAVVREPIPKSAFEINGVPDILVLNNHQLLVTERSFSSGYVTCNVRVYAAELNGAEDISQTPSLLKTPPQHLLRKTLLVNMDTLGINIYNIEGASFGPRLPNGKRSLLFVADDNFSRKEKTQFLLFEVD